MTSLRRATAFVTGLLLLLLTLQEGRPACAAHAMTAARSATAVMAAHDGMPASSHHDGCNTPHDATACASMPACATPPTLPARVAAFPPLAPRVHAALGERVAIHSEVLAGPDVPPPRG